jgi:hypothetical protein
MNIFNTALAPHIFAFRLAEDADMNRLKSTGLPIRDCVVMIPEGCRIVEPEKHCLTIWDKNSAIITIPKNEIEELYLTIEYQPTVHLHLRNNKVSIVDNPDKAVIFLTSENRLDAGKKIELEPSIPLSYEAE